MKGVVSHCHSCTSNEHRTSSTLCEVHKNLSSVMPGSLRDVFVSFFSGLLTSRSEDGFRSAPSHPRLANLTWRRGNSVPQARMRVAWVSCGLPCGCGSSLGSKEIAMLYFFLHASYSRTGKGFFRLLGVFVLLEALAWGRPALGKLPAAHAAVLTMAPQALSAAAPAVQSRSSSSSISSSSSSNSCVDGRDGVPYSFAGSGSGDILADSAHQVDGHWQCRNNVFATLWRHVCIELLLSE